MSLKPGSSRCSGTAAMNSSHAAGTLVCLSLCLTAAAPRLAAAGQFDSYASIDDSQSVVIGQGDEMAMPPDGSSHHAYAPYEGPGYTTDPCRGPYCNGCQTCRGHVPGVSGMLNRVLGDACPRITAQIDALMLWQSNIPSQPLLLAGDLIDAPVFFNANQLATDMAVGPRAALMLHLDQEVAIEANYFNVGSIGTTRPFTAPPGAQLAWANLAGLGLGEIDEGIIDSNGAIQSFELNWRHRHCGSPITWLVGFRWVEWNQTLRIQDNYSSFTFFGEDQLVSQVGNDLYGAQIGVDAILLTLWDTIRFNGVAKAGIYGNQATALTAVTTDRPIDISPSYAESRSQTAFFGEIGINGAVRLTDHFFWRAGYNFFWLSGVATPTEQLSAVNLTNDPATGTINAGSSVFLHGVNTGIEFIW